ncbi:YibE/F family protein [Cryptosporangium aurantiacum]|uniref:Uncharacterized membrane protein n=1 Tax=Cryptosporangium aurantiacum TaxID=134849 RepID=A0A1M7GZ39_9ACTN|nr:YibE/F family protein [Cryptosporangium aurantiacum]SHM21591.1 Uncharacterized membrane protein [Cryptosporangium aurantiacum]
MYSARGWEPDHGEQHPPYSEQYPPYPEGTYDRLNFQNPGQPVTDPPPYQQAPSWDPDPRDRGPWGAAPPEPPSRRPATEWPAPERPGPERPGHERQGREHYGSEPYGPERHGSEPYGSEPYGSEPYGPERHGSEHYGPDHRGPEGHRGPGGHGGPDHRGPEGHRGPGGHGGPEHHGSQRHGPELAADELVHSHTHSATTPVSARTRKAVIAILVPAIVATLIGLILLWPGKVDYSSSTGQSGQQQRAAGTVTEVVQQTCPETPEAESAGLTGPCGTATVKVTDGLGKGQTVSMELPQGPGAPRVDVGDDVVLLVLSDGSGEGETTARYTIVDKQRAGSLWLLAALAAVVVIGFGRLRGLAAIGGLVVSFAVLLLFIIPGILDGSPPLLVAVVGSAAIMFAVLYLTHGVSVRTSVAILGTLASLVLTGLLGAAFTALTELTGLGDEQSVYLATVEGGVDMRGLLLAGIIIGSLGVLDDVTITQSEVVAELARTPRSRFDLYRAAIRVGRAHVGSAVNTIVLAYAGASLPLLLLISVSGQSLSSLVTGQSIASELVRALVGTIGLVASVPITTALAALVAEPPAEDEEPARAA